jgi:hypothetical protein
MAVATACPGVAPVLPYSFEALPVRNGLLDFTITDAFSAGDSSVVVGRDETKSSHNALPL